MDTSVISRPNAKTLSALDRFSSLEALGVNTEPALDSDELAIEAIIEAPAKTRPVPGLRESALWMLGFIVMLSAPMFGVVVYAQGFEASQAIMQDNFLQLLLSGQVLCVCYTLFALRWRWGRDWMEGINLRRPKLVPALLAVVCLPFVSLLAIGTMFLVISALGVEMPEAQLLTDATQQQPLWFSLLVIAIGAAVNEELFCRGFLGRGLIGRHGLFVGVLATTVIFAFIHLNIHQGTVALILGTYLHLAYLATRSIWVPMLLHFIHNAVLTTLSVLVAAPAAGAEFPELTMAWYDYVIFAVLVLAAIASMVAAGIGLYRFRDRDTTEREVI